MLMLVCVLDAFNDRCQRRMSAIHYGIVVVKEKIGNRLWRKNINFLFNLI